MHHEKVMYVFSGAQAHEKTYRGSCRHASENTQVQAHLRTPSQELVVMREPQRLICNAIRPVHLPGYHCGLSTDVRFVFGGRGRSVFHE